MSQQSQQPPIICIMGPTASGKTDLAMALSDAIDGEIVSVDSALIYRGMDIGTAKPTSQELAQYPHRLIDIRDPSESYSVAEFCDDALREIAEIRSRGRSPILVGGTMMYFKNLIEGIAPLPPADDKVRLAIKRQAEQSGWQSLHQELADVDPASAERIHPNDPQRLMRAIEVYRLTGNTLTQLMAIKALRVEGDVLQFGLLPDDRGVLHQRIEQRFHQMVANGFEQEVAALMARSDLHEDLSSIRCVGYRQMWQYLQGDGDHDEMVFRGICATRQLAKRQLTWLRSWPDLIPLPMMDKTNLATIELALSKL